MTNKIDFFHLLVDFSEDLKQMAEILVDVNNQIKQNGVIKTSYYLTDGGNWGLNDIDTTEQEVHLVFNSGDNFDENSYDLFLSYNNTGKLTQLLVQQANLLGDIPDNDLYLNFKNIVNMTVNNVTVNGTEVKLGIEIDCNEAINVWLIND